MDLRTTLDDEDFFDRYACEQAVAEVDAADTPSPSAEELAHHARFRKPVAWIVTGLALFSLLALEEHGARRAFLARYGAPRELVAHYGSALAGPAKGRASAAEGELPSRGEPVMGAAEQSDSSPAAVFVSLLTSMCLPECSSELGPLARNDADEPAAAALLDLCLAPGQARHSWSHPHSMTWSNPSVRR
ncbi:MAG TPA: hypothetical protein VFK05_21195 [Polyangiaceae bacterium]|nr:hypothetical protein [Polyangiaceae bacterium]